jgi:hypothetical protein
MLVSRPNLLPSEGGRCPARRPALATVMFAPLSPRGDSLKWSHYKYAAGEEDRAELLRQVDDEQWSTEKLRQFIHDRNSDRKPFSAFSKNLLGACALGVFCTSPFCCILIVGPRKIFAARDTFTCTYDCAIFQQCRICYLKIMS